MKIVTFNLPDLGEGLPDVELIAWHVQEGEQVVVDQPIVAVETAKAVIDLPAPITGKVHKIYVAVGAVVAVGAKLLDLEIVEDLEVSKNFQVAVQASTLQEAINTDPAPALIGKILATEQIRVTKQDPEQDQSNVNYRVLALPAVRALAEKLNIDLSTIQGTGKNNIITLKDLTNAFETHVGSKLTDQKLAGYDQHKIVDLAKDHTWQTLHTADRAMALELQKTQQTGVVAATIVEDLILPKYSKATFDITIEIIKAISFACSKEPKLNAWFIKQNEFYYQKIMSVINLGIAIDHSEGLFMPVITDISNKSKAELRTELDQILQQAKLDPYKLAHNKTKRATFILSNFGKFAGRYATPVVITPMVAILAVGSLRQEVVVLNGKIEISAVLPISLSFDHRAITGGQAARFMQAIIEFFRT